MGLSAHRQQSKDRIQAHALDAPGAAGRCAEIAGEPAIWPPTAVDTTGGASYSAPVADATQLTGLKSMVFEIVTEPLQQAAQAGAPGVLDGKAVAAALLIQVQSATAALAQRGIVPTLAVVRVGDDEASEIYVRHKERACARVGIEFRHEHLPATTSEEEVLAALRRL